MTPELEEWRDVEGWPEYRVSSWGRVLGMRGAILAPRPDRGYVSVTLCREGEHRSEWIHRLVLFAFVGPPPTPEHEGDHENKVRSDNRLGNLRWLTKADNLAQREFEHGEDRAQAKLTEDGVRYLRGSSKSTYKLARELGVCQGVVWRAKARKTWRHVQ
jgi:hypothetical protein